MDPVSMAATSMAIGAVGSAVAGIGAQQEGAANSAMYKYKAGVARLNREVNMQNANWAIEAGESQAVTSGMKSAQMIAKTKVDQAASGLDINSGTAKAVRDSQTDVAAYDQNVIRFNARKTAYGYETKAATDEAEATLDEMAASKSSDAGNIKMLTSFISGASSVASKWTQGQTLGMGQGKNPYYAPLDAMRD